MAQLPRGPSPVRATCDSTNTLSPVSITPLSTSISRRLAGSDRQVAAATEVLSTGLRIVRAADDAAGLTTAERLLARHTGLAVAERNALDGVSMVRTADGALSALHSQLQRVRELAVQWSNGTLSARDRTAIEAEASLLGEEAARLYESTSFNGMALLQGGTFSLQIGAGDKDALGGALPDLVPLLDEDPFTFAQATTTTTTTTGTTTTAPGGAAHGWHKKNGSGSGSGAGSGTTTTTVTLTDPIQRVDWAIEVVTQQRGHLGAVENILSHRIRSLAVEREQLVAAEARIRDADIADSMAELTRASILRSAQVALAQQAQQLERGRVLALLG